MNILAKLPQNTNAYYDSSFDRWVPGEGVIFVVGTNLSGRHGAGAALAAAQYYGAPEGHYTGQIGGYYGIPTRRFISRRELQTLSLDDIWPYVQEFVLHTQMTSWTFLVTPIGTGRAGYPDNVIAPMFRDAVNCWFPDRWKEYIE